MWLRTTEFYGHIWLLIKLGFSVKCPPGSSRRAAVYKCKCHYNDTAWIASPFSEKLSSPSTLPKNDNNESQTVQN